MEFKRELDIKVANVVEEGKLGGPQIRMVRVAASVAGRAETLIVMPESNSESFCELCDSNDVPYRILSLTRITKEWRVALGYLLLSPIEILRLAKLFRHEEVNLVHASGGSWQFKGVVAARLAGVPSVWHLNDTAMPGWLRLLFRLVQPLASGFIFASHRSCAYYGDLIRGTRPEAIVPSAVDPEHFDPAAKSAGDEETLSDYGGAPVIGTVANVNPIKGLETLIRAIALLLPQHADLRLAVIGAVHINQERYFHSLEQLATKQGVKVDWLGERSDVRPLLRRFDVYVCSSLAESSPVSVWEAMALSRPVVSTDVGDVALHARDGEAGFIVPVGDADAMAERIHRLLGDTGLRNRMGQAARKAAIAGMSTDIIAEKTLAIYKTILKTHSGTKASRRRTAKGNK